MATAVLPGASFADAFPCSTKVHVSGRHGVQVPMREITLGDSPDGTANPPLRVYDTSGPQGHDVREGLPALRLPWIVERNVSTIDHDQALGIAMPPGLNRRVLRGTGRPRTRSSRAGKTRIRAAGAATGRFLNPGLSR